MVAGVLFAGLGLISLSFVQSLWMFYVSLLIFSLGTGLCMGIPRTWTIVQWFQRLRGRALGIQSSGGVLIGPLLIIVVWLTEAFGWRGALQVLGVITWLVGVPLALVFRGRPQQYGYLPDGRPASDGASPQAAPQRGTGLTVRYLPVPVFRRHTGSRSGTVHNARLPDTAPVLSLHFWAYLL
jgi:sugar phosphate permease